MEQLQANGVVVASELRSTPGVADPQVPAKRARRHFSIEEKARIVREADACAPGEQGALLRREGIYSSLLTNWRRERDRGEYDATARRERTQTVREAKTAAARIAELEREIRKLRRRLERAELIRELQKKQRGSWDGIQ
ncbi:MAG: transposase [Vulcanimicrobiaceae bacterium]